MSRLVTGIGQLVTNDPAVGDGSRLGLLADAAVVIEDGRVAWLGPATAAPAADDRTDLGGRAVVPGFVDSHAHLVFAGDRAGEFAARMAGTPYDGGGIAATVEATRAASDDVHFFRMMKELTILGYCTSEAGATKLLRYAPYPGPYHGDVPHSEVGKAWAL